MKLNPFALISFFLSVLTLLSSDWSSRPNVVLILVDDLGWQDVGCYDIDEPTPMETPHIDSLAKKGVQFWQGYSPAPTCAPTRCSIISGRHPAVLQKTHVVGGNPPTPYNKIAHPVMDPWYSGRLKLEEVTIAEALKMNGYVSGHTGKWHMAIDHNAFPQPEDQGFDFTRHHLGASAAMRPHRLTGFASIEENDPYKLDEKGFPKDQMTLDALDFMKANKDRPFFLYYASWLVHTPIHSRSKALLEKYCKKLGLDYPSNPTGWSLQGQKNPYYCAMVEMLDYYVGQIIAYLENTPDPRRPGHFLISNTYVIFTSDNGGMERVPGEVITDNFPLDRGKINAKEGGVRVPLIITGPTIRPGQESHVMVNGLDFYPTILSWTGTKKPKNLNLDGSDLSELLHKHPRNPDLVKDNNGNPRNSMVWHFPHGVAQQSTIRMDGWKLIKNWMPGRPEFELYQLHEESAKQLKGGRKELFRRIRAMEKRVDIEESNNLADKMPERVEAMSKELFRRLDAMNASYPYFNPFYKGSIDGKDQICVVVKQGQKENEVWAEFKENGSKVKKAQILYTLNGGERSEEWYVGQALVSGNKVTAKLPKESTHYFFNLVDEKNFLVSFPVPMDMLSAGKTRPKGLYSQDALVFKN